MTHEIVSRRHRIVGHCLPLYLPEEVRFRRGIPAERRGMTPFSCFWKRRHVVGTNRAPIPLGMLKCYYYQKYHIFDISSPTLQVREMTGSAEGRAVGSVLDGQSGSVF